MCIETVSGVTTMNTRMRRLQVFASLCLVLGILPKQIIAPAFFHSYPVASFVSGLFLGLAIVLQLQVLVCRRSARRSRLTDPSPVARLNAELSAPQPAPNRETAAD